MQQVEDSQHHKEVKEVQLMMSSIKSMGLFEEGNQPSTGKKSRGVTRSRSPQAARRIDSSSKKERRLGNVRDSMVSIGSKINYNLSDSDEGEPLPEMTEVKPLNVSNPPEVSIDLPNQIHMSGFNLHADL